MADAGETTQSAVDGTEKETGLHDPVSGFGASGNGTGQNGPNSLMGSPEMSGKNPGEPGKNPAQPSVSDIKNWEKNQETINSLNDPRSAAMKAALDKAYNEITGLCNAQIQHSTNSQNQQMPDPMGACEIAGTVGGVAAANKAAEKFDKEHGITGYDQRMGFPIVLDLDSDGLDLVALDKSKAFYDIDGDGYLENVGWVGKGDGFLSIDLNGDGLILEPVELAFALSTDDPDDTDLEGLAATYDTNQDGVLDSNDADFAKFKVWIDIDQDGTCDAGEVKSLAEVGVTSINLTSDNKEEVIAGNKVYGSTTYTKSDGTTGKVGDVGLATSAAGWKKEEVSGGIKFNYEGTGDNAGKAQGQALFEAAAATALIMDVGASGLIGAMGAELDDDLSTSGKEDVILGGGAGNDKIKGGEGNDWLAGGEGIDSISGGAGHDILFVDSEDKIDGGKGFDVAIVTDTRRSLTTLRRSASRRSPPAPAMMC